MSATRIDKIKHGTQINEITVPDQLRKRYPFHSATAERLKFVTNLYGGEGITPSTVTLLTGTPGSGKSTLLLQIAHALHQHPDCVVLFNGGEESLYQTRLVCERLFRAVTPTFYVGHDCLADGSAQDLHYKVRHEVQTGARHSLLGHARALKKKHPDKQLIILHDSLQTLDDGKYPDGATNGQTPIRALKLINDHCKKTFDSAIVIGQVTKAGDPTGANKLLHDVDVWIHLKIDTKDKSETKGMRIIQTCKNRYGTSGLAHILNMYDSGVTEEGAYFEE